MVETIGWVKAMLLALIPLFDENMAVVILLDNALGERESESPAALLGGKAGLENRLEVAVGNAAPRVGEEDACATRMCLCRNRDAAAGFHGIDGILAEVLHHPL